MNDFMNGALRTQLDAGAEAAGTGISDLTVLAPQNDPYRWDTPRGHSLGAWFAQEIALHVPYGDVHLRGLHYRLISGTTKPNGKPYINDDSHWIWLGKASQAARWLGYVPFGKIRDQRNDPPEIFIVDEPAAPGYGRLLTAVFVGVPSLDDMRPTVHAHCPTTRQPYRIILLGEKSSLAGELTPIAERVEAELILPIGEATDTLIARMAERAARDDRPAKVFYFADFDPSGWQMPISFSRKIQALRDLRHPELQMEVYRVALTLPQCHSFNLPSTPLKETERRADRWQAMMQREQTELDALIALQPGALRRIAEDAIASFFDPTLKRRAASLARVWEIEAERRLLSSDQYAPACALIENARSGVTAAVEALEEAAAEAERMLPAFGHQNIPAPEPIIEWTAPQPLFSTDDDFVTASRKLIASKRLDGAQQ